MPGNFTDAAINDERLRDIKIVYITALCSKSGVANPVSFVVTEGEGIAVFVHKLFHTSESDMSYVFFSCSKTVLFLKVCIAKYTSQC